MVRVTEIDDDLFDIVAERYLHHMHICGQQHAHEWDWRTFIEIFDIEESAQMIGTQRSGVMGLLSGI